MADHRIINLIVQLLNSVKMDYKSLGSMHLERKCEGPNSMDNGYACELICGMI